MKDTNQSQVKAGLMAQKITEKQRSSVYEKTVVDFVNQDKGCFIVMSDDPTFISLLRTVLYKNLGLLPEVLVSVQDVGDILKTVKDANDKMKKPFIFIERRFKGQDMAFMIKQFKGAFPNSFILALTIEVERDRIMFLHEMGVDNFIAKPVSAQTVVEKMAFTIKAQSKLGMLIEKAKSLLRNNDPQAAKTVAEEVLILKEGSSAALMVVGDAEMAMGDMEAAKKAYQDASDNTALYLEPLYKLANLAKEMGDMESCLKCLEKLDKLSPLNCDRKVSMGEINLNLGKAEKAHDLFDVAMQQITKEAMCQISSVAERIASIYAEIDPVRSEEFLRKALEGREEDFTREDLKIFNRLGISLRQQGRWQQAIDEYDKALNIAPDDAGLYYNRSMALMEGGMFSDARKSMDQGMKCNPKFPYLSPDVAYNMGMVYLKDGARDHAQKYFEIALELNPTLHHAKEALAKL